MYLHLHNIEDSCPHGLDTLSHSISHIHADLFEFIVLDQEPILYSYTNVTTFGLL